jgi:YfiR/HmsC-like
MKHWSLTTRRMIALCNAASSRSHWILGSLLAALALPALLLAARAPAQAPRPNAQQVQAAYLFNFGKFVKWPTAAPANRSGSFIICVLEQDPFGAVLQSTLAGESVGGKPVSVKRLAKAQDAVACHILFISSGQNGDLKEILAAVDRESVLTVSDMPNFSRRGGMIQFVLVGDRIRFEINLEGAEKSNLVFPSELLKVATAVKKPAGPGE